MKAIEAGSEPVALHLWKPMGRCRAPVIRRSDSGFGRSPAHRAGHGCRDAENRTEGPPGMCKMHLPASVRVYLCASVYDTGIVTGWRCGRAGRYPLPKARSPMICVLQVRVCRTLLIQGAFRRPGVACSSQQQSILIFAGTRGRVQGSPDLSVKRGALHNDGADHKEIHGPHKLPTRRS
jgi:hypothetical protein